MGLSDMFREIATHLKRTNGRTIMTRKDDNGSMATRLSLAAGVLLMLLAGATEARDPNNPYSYFTMFLRNLDLMILRLKQDLNDYSTPLDVISIYYTYAILALGSRQETQSELMKSLNYLSTDYILADAALLNKTIPTYSQYSFESYINLSEEAELDSEFERIVTQYIPFIEKRRFETLCKGCGYAVPAMYRSQQVCFASFSDYKADWATQFDPQQTSKGTFSRINGSVKKINFMTRTGSALYKEDKEQFKMQMLTLPSANLDSFLILMKPNDGTDMYTFGRRIYSAFGNLIKNVLYQQAPTNVKIRLPKFKVSSDMYFPQMTDSRKKIWTSNAQTAILKKYPETYIIYFISNTTMELNEEGINYQADAVAGNGNCAKLPKRNIPTLKKSDVQSPFAVPEIVSLVAGIANETLKPASETVVEFSGDSPFLYMILTTDLTVLTTGGYDGFDY